MKKHTIALIWTAALIVLVLGFLCIYLGSNGLFGNTVNKPIEVFNCSSAKIEGYSVTSNKGNYELEKEKDGWYIEDDKKAELDQSAIEKMIASASKITANGTISRKQLAEFDKTDKRTLEIDVEDGEDLKIWFLGSRNNLCAFKVSGDIRTYVMYESVRDILTPPLENLRITAVFPELLKTDTLPDYYTYQDYDKTVMEVRTKTASELATGKNNKYMMERPYKREVDDDSFEQQIAVKIPLMRVKEFIKNPSEDKSVYGLDPTSRAELSFLWNKKTYTLYLGKSENGAVYAMKKDKSDVFTINAPMLEFLQVEPFYILDSGILKNISEKITGVKVVKGDTVYNITSSKGADGLRQYFLNGKAASSYVFNEIIEELGDLKFKNEIHKEPQNTKDIEITVSYENGSTQNISLVKTSEKAYAVFSGGKAEFEIYTKDVYELMEELNEAINNPAKMD